VHSNRRLVIGRIVKIGGITMPFRKLPYAFAIGAIILIAPIVALAQGGAMKVGELKELSAWVNKMPVGIPSFHVTGKITAPTPCHEVLTEYAGDLKTHPPVYRVKVSLRSKPGIICIQKLSDLNFHYLQPNYAGSHGKAQVSSDQDSKDVNIEVVQ
jgi:hypothetical protein